MYESYYDCIYTCKNFGRILLLLCRNYGIRIGPSYSLSRHLGLGWWSDVAMMRWRWCDGDGAMSRWCDDHDKIMRQCGGDDAMTQWCDRELCGPIQIPYGTFIKSRVFLSLFWTLYIYDRFIYIYYSDRLVFRRWICKMAVLILGLFNWFSRFSKGNSSRSMKHKKATTTNKNKKNACE